MSDVISLLKNDFPSYDSQHDLHERLNEGREDVLEELERRRKEEMMSDKENLLRADIWGMQEEIEEEEDSNVSTSASEASNPGEYEESEE